MTNSNFVSTHGFGYSLDKKVISFPKFVPELPEHHYVLSEEINPLNPDEIFYFVTNPHVDMVHQLLVYVCPKDNNTVLRTTTMDVLANEYASDDNEQVLEWFAHMLSMKAVCFAYPRVILPIDIDKDSVGIK